MISNRQVSRWHALCSRMGAHTLTCNDVLYRIEKMYFGRYYHDMQHVFNCLGEFDIVRGRTDYPDEAEMALWMHDVIYEPEKGGSEYLSAQYAGSALKSMGVSDEKIDRVKKYIMATTHTEPPRNHDCAIVMDCDLATLAVGIPREIEESIKKEYAWMKGYVGARKKFLIELYNRNHIFNSPEFARYNELAKNNVLMCLAYHGADVVLGGTFDLLHRGHKKLIMHAFKLAGKNGAVMIGVTSDAMASKKSHPVQSFEARHDQIEEFIDREHLNGRVSGYIVVLIEDPYGATLSEDYNFDVLVASEETAEGAKSVNEVRALRGLPPLAISLISCVLNGRGEKISSTRMHAGRL